MRINREGLIPMITVRDAARREITLPHYELLAEFEFRGGMPLSIPCPFFS